MDAIIPVSPPQLAAPLDYLQRHVARELPPKIAEAAAGNESGMVWEDGLLIFGAGTPLPPGYIDNALRLSREERSQHILGHRDYMEYPRLYSIQTRDRPSREDASGDHRLDF